MVVTYSNGRRRRVAGHLERTRTRCFVRSRSSRDDDVGTVSWRLLRCSPRTKPKVTEVRIFINSRRAWLDNGKDECRCPYLNTWMVMKFKICHSNEYYLRMKLYMKSLNVLLDMMSVMWWVDGRLSSTLQFSPLLSDPKWRTQTGLVGQGTWLNIIQRIDPMTRTRMRIYLHRTFLILS